MLVYRVHNFCSPYLSGGPYSDTYGHSGSCIEAILYHIDKSLDKRRPEDLGQAEKWNGRYAKGQNKDH